jgi:hypothetical protein
MMNFLATKEKKRMPDDLITRIGRTAAVDIRMYSVVVSDAMCDMYLHVSTRGLGYDFVDY